MIEELDRAIVSEPDFSTTEVVVASAGGVERVAIRAHAPTTITFPSLVVPAEAFLSFGVGIADMASHGSDGVRFRVRAVDESGEIFDLWQHELKPLDSAADREWFDVAIPLSRFGSTSVDLVLETHELESVSFDQAFWSLPALRSGGREVSLTDNPVDRSHLIDDLGPIDAKVFTQEISTGRDRHLDLVGEIFRQGSGPGLIGPVEFTATLDGETLLARSLRTRGRNKSFSVRLSLPATDTREATLVLEMKPQDARQSQAGYRWIRAAVVESRAVARGARSKGPNVLFVVVDTLRADHMSIYSYEKDTSPRLADLSRKSIVVEGATAQASWTMPSVASLLTGLYPPEHGVTDGQALELTFETLAERAQQAGLTTFGMSANPIVGRTEGFDQGFERFVHLPWARAEHVNNTFGLFLENSLDLQWFGYLHYIDPHDPYEAPMESSGGFAAGLQSEFSDRKRFAELTAAINFGIGSEEMTAEDLEYLVAAYDDEIFSWDTEFHRLLEHLRELEILDNTVIVVTSDHGEEFFEHGLLKHGIHLYNESIRVPLLIHCPNLKTGRRLQGPLETRRLFESLSEVFDLGLDARICSKEWNPSDEALFSHTNHARRRSGPRGRTTLVSVERDGWKYLKGLDFERTELFHLEIDKGESTNLVGQQPEVEDRMNAILDRWVAATADARANDRSPPQSTVEQLRALGYVK